MIQKRKLMSTVHEIDHELVLLVKGAPDVVFDRSNQILTNDGVRQMTDKDLVGLREKNEAFSNRALRVLAFAYRPLENKNIDFESENDLIFVGLLAMIDPPREEVFDAIKQAKSAGIQPIMITGDHKTTARAIAEQIGLFEAGDLALTGAGWTIFLMKS